MASAEVTRLAVLIDAENASGSDTRCMPEITNANLHLEDVPAPDADPQVIGAFALTFDGYEHWGSFEKCAEIANAKRHETLTDLRTCLFFEQRRWRHFGESPDDETRAYWGQLVVSIRQKVSADERN